MNASALRPTIDLPPPSTGVSHETLPPNCPFCGRMPIRLAADCIHPWQWTTTHSLNTHGTRLADLSSARWGCVLHPAQRMRFPTLRSRLRGVWTVSGSRDAGNAAKP